MQNKTQNFDSSLHKQTTMLIFDSAIFKYFKHFIQLLEVPNPE